MYGSRLARQQIEMIMQQIEKVSSIVTCCTLEALSRLIKHNCACQMAHGRSSFRRS